MKLLSYNIFSILLLISLGCDKESSDNSTQINTIQSTNSTITSNSSSSNNSELVSPNLNQNSITFEETTITFSEEDRQPSNRTTGNWGRFGGIGVVNLSLEYADNPETNNENQSSKVIKVTEPSGIQSWAGFYFVLEEKIVFPEGKEAISIQFYSPGAGHTVLLKLEDELPSVYSYVKHNANVKQKIHLELNNGDPFLIDFDRGNGKIFYFTSLLNLNWNDLTLRGLLIPLMYRLLILGGTDEVNSLPVLVGDTKWINLKGNEVRNEWQVQSPSGIKNLIVPDFSKESLKITDTNEHGIYSVLKNKKLYTSFSTMLHQSEIVSKKISENEVDILFKELEYKWIAPSNNFINILLNSTIQEGIIDVDNTEFKWKSHAKFTLFNILPPLFSPWGC